MTVPEFSNEFDILYNNIMSNQAPGLNEYEKSVFLTLAQEALIINLYNGSAKGISFEENEEIKRYLSSLIRTIDIEPSSDKEGLLTDYSTKFNLPEDVMFITYEAALTDKLFCDKTKWIPVVASNQDEIYKIINNPFKGASDNRVLRLDIDDSSVELISKNNIEKYRVRYLSKPTPIILVDLDEYYPNLSIKGKSEVTECVLDSSLHMEILNQAVALAKQSYVMQ